MNRLKQIRERKSLTLAQVSARTSIPLRLLGDYEANVQEIPPAHLKVLSKALWVKPEELLLPAGAPSPPPSPVAAPPMAPAAPGMEAAAPPAPSAPAMMNAGMEMAPGAPPAVPAPAYSGPRTYTPAPPPYGAPRPPRPGGPPDGARGGRAPIRARREPVVMPATDGQVTEIMRLAARLNLSTEEIERQFGRGIDNITRFDAREWIKKLREDALAKAPPAKVHFGQWPGLKEDREAAYLNELRETQAELRVTLFNGQVFDGPIVDFTPYTITLDGAGGDSGEQVVLRKLAIAYYQRMGTASGEATASGPAKEIAPFEGPSAPPFAPPAGETASSGAESAAGAEESGG